MKRNFDLIRSILRDVEEIAPNDYLNSFVFEGADQMTIDAHAMLLVEAGFLDGKMLPISSGRSPYRITGLTWEGHDFLDAMKDDNLWAKAKKTVINPVGGVAFSVLKDWLLAEAKTRLGL